MEGKLSPSRSTDSQHVSKIFDYMSSAENLPAATPTSLSDNHFVEVKRLVEQKSDYNYHIKSNKHKLDALETVENRSPSPFSKSNFS